MDYTDLLTAENLERDAYDLVASLMHYMRDHDFDPNDDTTIGAAMADLAYDSTECDCDNLYHATTNNDREFLAMLRADLAIFMLEDFLRKRGYIE